MTGLDWLALLWAAMGILTRTSCQLWVGYHCSSKKSGLAEKATIERMNWLNMNRRERAADFWAWLLVWPYRAWQITTRVA